MADNPSYRVTVSRVLLVIAMITFVLAAFGVSPLGPVEMVPAGLAFFAASFLIP